MLEINLKFISFSLPLYLSQNFKELTVFSQTGCKGSYFFQNSKFFPKKTGNNPILAGYKTCFTILAIFCKKRYLFHKKTKKLTSKSI